MITHGSDFFCYSWESFGGVREECNRRFLGYVGLYGVVVVFIQLWDLMVRKNTVVTETEVDRPGVGVCGGGNRESRKIHI